MFRPHQTRGAVALAVILLLSLSSSTFAVQDESKKKKPTPKGTPVLWKAPEDIASRDLFLGPGGAAMKPNLGKITFIKVEEGGTSTKYRVRDASGREWVAKVGSEAQSETSAVRLLWAVGYVTEVNYLAPRVEIVGKGTYENVRFEARPKEVKRGADWKWDDNPFVGTPELQGLKVMMVLFNNWDLKDSNNKILSARGAGGNENRYVISDLGATFGKTGDLPLLWRVTRSRNKPEDYEKAKFIDGVKERRVDFHYGGKNGGILGDIGIAQAKWMGGWLARLSDRQIRDAFRAANYRPEEVDMLAETIRARIEELNGLPE